MADVTQETEIAPIVLPQTLPDDGRPELGHLARWHVSSHKYGFGVDNLRDNDENTFWQSEGPQPHVIDLTFPKRVSVSAVALRTSHPRDDSYTPSKISVRAGTSVHDLQEVQVREFSKPDGWIYIPMRPNNPDTFVAGEDDEGPPIPCYHLRVLIIANHLNGKDTHVRGLKIFGPNTSAEGSGDSMRGIEQLTISDTTGSSQRKKKVEGLAAVRLGHDGLSGFTSQAFKMHEGIR